MTRKIYKADYVGTLKIGDLKIPCAVLPDGIRVLSQRAVGRALGRGYGGKDWKKQEEAGGGKMPFYLSAGSLKPYISNELMAVANNLISYRYRHSTGGTTAQGIQASALPEICDVWLKARDAGALNETQKIVAKKAEILMRGLAHIGIIALVDEATGYQEIRDKKALAAILDKYLRKELAAWAKKFPDEFYKEMFRLRDWNWSYLKRPAYVGKLTNDVVYERITPGLLEELKKRAPKNEEGKRKGTLQQLFTDDIGHPALAQHLHAVTGLMRAASNWEGFYRLLQRSFPKKNDQLPLLLDD